MKKGKRLARMDILQSPIYPKVKGFEFPHYWWRLVGGNGQIICVSETFTRKADAMRSMRRALEIIRTKQFEVVDD